MLDFNEFLSKLNEKISFFVFIQDFVSVITSFCARVYGLRRSRRKTEQLIEELKKTDEVD